MCVTGTWKKANTHIYLTHFDKLHTLWAWTHFSQHTYTLFCQMCVGIKSVYNIHTFLLTLDGTTNIVLKISVTLQDCNCSFDHV